MKNNLPWLIKRAELKPLEFGMEVYPDMPSDTEKNKRAITERVTRMCKENVRAIPFEIWDKMAEILDADYNQMFGYND